MTVVQESGTGIKRYRGLSTDAKPGVDDLGIDSAFGSIFTEVDTGNRYVWGGHVWVRQEQTIETLFAELMQLNQDILAELKVIRQATATMANGQWGTDYPTG